MNHESALGTTESPAPTIEDLRREAQESLKDPETVAKAYKTLADLYKPSAETSQENNSTEPSTIPNPSRRNFMKQASAALAGLAATAVLTPEGSEGSETSRLEIKEFVKENIDSFTGDPGLLTEYQALIGDRMYVKDNRYTAEEQDQILKLDARLRKAFARIYTAADEVKKRLLPLAEQNQQYIRNWYLSKQQDPLVENKDFTYTSDEFSVLVQAFEYIAPKRINTLRYAHGENSDYYKSEYDTLARALYALTYGISDDTGGNLKKIYDDGPEGPAPDRISKIQGKYGKK